MNVLCLATLLFGVLGEPIVNPVPQSESAVGNDTTAQQGVIEDRKLDVGDQTNRGALSDNPIEQLLILNTLLGTGQGQGQAQTQNQRPPRRAKGGSTDDAVNMLLLMSMLGNKGGQSTVSTQDNQVRKLDVGGSSNSAVPLLQQLALQSLLGQGQSQASQTCQGGCGRPMLKQDCGCDFECEVRRDCCSDYYSLCSQTNLQQPAYLSQRPIYTAPQVIYPPATQVPLILAPVQTPVTPAYIPPTSAYTRSGQTSYPPIQSSAAPVQTVSPEATSTAIPPVITLPMIPLSALSPQQQETLGSASQPNTTQPLPPQVVLLNASYIPTPYSVPIPQIVAAMQGNTTTTSGVILNRKRHGKGSTEQTQS